MTIATTKIFLVFGVLFLLVGIVSVNVYNENKVQQPTEPNYKMLYTLGLIPNSPELPATKADKIIVVSNDGTHALIQSPFGKVYERGIN